MWLFTIAAHVLANHHRSTNRRIALAERLRAQLATTPPTVDPAEASAVRDTVHRLKDTHRELVMLIHWDGFSLVEAAEILDMNASTARSRYAAARAMLTDALAETVSR
jgi:RNA polymerase sigma-70 factor (ECF subfamily)